MSNNIGIITASIILSSSYLAGIYFSTEQQPLPLPAEMEPRILSASAEDIFHLRSECGELGHKLMDGNLLPASLDQSYQSNYDIKTNRCYVELSISSVDPFVANFVLYDAQTNELLASLQSGKNPPTGTIFDLNYHKLIDDQTYSDVLDYIQNKMADSRQQ